MNIFDKSFIKFCIVGVINTIIGYGTIFILYNYFMFTYWMSTLSGNTVGATVSFFLNNFFTFKCRKKNIESIIHFVFIILICYFISYRLSYFFVNFLIKELNIIYIDTFKKENISMFLGMSIYTILNYMGQKYFVFKK